MYCDYKEVSSLVSSSVLPELCYRTPTDASEDAECEDVDIKMNKAIISFRGVNYAFYMNDRDSLFAFIDNFVFCV
jgi:hypothetical protein